MNQTSVHALTLARPVLRGLTILNLLYAAGIAALLAFSFFIEGWPQRPLGFDLTHAHPNIGNGLRVIIVIGILGAVVVHTILRRLLTIVDTVRAGDPFTLRNARHLHVIAWSVLTLEVLRLPVRVIASAVWEPGRLGGFSFTPWLAVLLLFVLAGVFAHGARMRDDLEGTI